jgi:hypothetical protein
MDGQEQFRKSAPENHNEIFVEANSSFEEARPTQPLPWSGSASLDPQQILALFKRSYLIFQVLPKLFR